MKAYGETNSSKHLRFIRKVFKHEAIISTSFENMKKKIKLASLVDFCKILWFLKILT
jgi:hypothetical protein